MRKGGEKRRINLTGNRYGKYVVIKEDEEKRDPPHVICVCDCGNFASVNKANLTRGRQRSCGCEKSQRIRYSPQTGLFFSKKGVLRNIGTDGYLEIYHKYHGRIRGHRLAWLIIHGSIPPDYEIDHINRVRTDNRLCNLRCVTKKQNIANSPTRTGSASQYKGVHKSRRGNKWQAQCSIEGRRINLGAYPTEEEAATAYNAYVIGAGFSTAYLNDIAPTQTNGSNQMDFDSIQDVR